MDRIPIWQRPSYLVYFPLFLGVFLAGYAVGYAHHSYQDSQRVLEEVKKEPPEKTFRELGLDPPRK